MQQLFLFTLPHRLVAFTAISERQLSSRQKPTTSSHRQQQLIVARKKCFGSAQARLIAYIHTHTQAYTYTQHCDVLFPMAHVKSSYVKWRHDQNRQPCIIRVWTRLCMCVCVMMMLRPHFEWWSKKVLYVMASFIWWCDNYLLFIYFRYSHTQTRAARKIFASWRQRKCVVALEKQRRIAILTSSTANCCLCMLLFLLLLW